jgi:hypothetical protein
MKKRQQGNDENKKEEMVMTTLKRRATMSMLWLNKPHKFIISHARAKRTNVSRVGTLCTSYRHTVDYSSQAMKIKT